MEYCFCIYYYVCTNIDENVKLLAICTSYPKCLKLLSANFHNFKSHINNTITCRNKKQLSCILWIDVYQTDRQIENKNTNYSMSVINILSDLNDLSMSDKNK